MSDDEILGILAGFALAAIFAGLALVADYLEREFGNE